MTHPSIDVELVADKLELAAAIIVDETPAAMLEAIYKVAGSKAMQQAMWDAVAVVPWRNTYGLELPARHILDAAHDRIRCSLLEREFEALS